jgi:phage terminase large subunit-like protein
MPRLNAQALLALPYEQMVEVIRRWNRKNIAETQSWNFWARNDQAEPPEDWRIWLVMAGRGYGKTRMGAEWVSAMAAQHPGARFALVGATLNEARAVMVEGESGLLSLPFGERPSYEPSLRRLTWPNQATATLFSGAEPESLRGPQHDFAWADEIAKWPSGIAAWDNLMLGLRLGG